VTGDAICAFCSLGNQGGKIKSPSRERGAGRKIKLAATSLQRISPKSIAFSPLPWLPARQGVAVLVVKVGIFEREGREQLVRFDCETFGEACDFAREKWDRVGAEW
jgi:hypothetical protein